MSQTGHLLLTLLTMRSSWHADVKPENILCVYGEFKLCDFGFAKFSDFNWADQVPTSFILGGTAAYGEGMVHLLLPLGKALF